MVVVALLIVIAAASTSAFPGGWYVVAGRGQLATGTVVAALLVAAILTGGYLLSPLWQGTSSDEQSENGDGSPGREPTSAMPATSGSPTSVSTTVPIEPRVVLAGEFRGADDFHFGRGMAVLVETGLGVYTVRFEDFSVRNGIDLFVYLSPSADGYAEGVLNLGRLKATDGDFNYEVVQGTDVSGFRSAIVWSRQLGELFALARLSPVP